jgi:hypothetical protein
VAYGFRGSSASVASTPIASYLSAERVLHYPLSLADVGIPCRGEKRVRRDGGKEPTRKAEKRKYLPAYRILKVFFNNI